VVTVNRKKWLVLLIVLAVFVSGVMVEALYGAYDAMANEPDLTWEETVVSGAGDSKIVQLFVTGVISGEPNNAATPPMTEVLADQLRRIEEDEQVKAIVLRIDSPGGEVVATDEIHQRLMRLKAIRKIPIVVSMGSTAASGGYYLATAGDVIFANPSTMTGSLGVIFTLINYGETASRFGLKQYVIKSGRYKDIGSPVRPLTEAERNIFQTLVNESYQRFVDVIVQGRKLPRQRVLPIADGRIYSGSQAKKLGLIDQIGDLEQATNHALSLIGEDEALVVRYSENLTLGNLLFSLQKYWTNPDPLGVNRLLERSPRLLYQYLP
jgi:protease-4